MKCYLKNMVLIVPQIEHGISRNNQFKKRKSPVYVAELSPFCIHDVYLAVLRVYEANEVAILIPSSSKPIRDLLGYNLSVAR